MVIKKCITCHEEKEYTEFYKNRAKKDGLQGKCKACEKEYGRQWYLKNQELTYSRTRQYKKNIKNYVYKLKTESGCSWCKESHPACLIFHHVNLDDKITEVSKLVTNGVGKKRIDAEIAKCIVLCFNCHAKHHFG